MRSANWLAGLGAAVALLIVMATLFAPLLAPFPPLTIHAQQEFLPPGGAYTFGSDSFGRDVLSRALWGGRATLLAAALATTIAVGLGLAAGGLAGMGGVWLDWGLMRAVDVMLSIPGLLLAMALIAVLGVGEPQAALAVGVSLAPGFARVVRVTVVSVRQQGYVEAARAIGARPAGIFLRHVLPNVAPQVVGFAAVNFGWALLNLATLDFLGLSGLVSDPTWGRMLAEGRRYLRRAPWIALTPGLMLVSTVAAITLLGDVVRRREPRTG